MSKAKEIWEILRRKDFRDGDEVHAVKFNGDVLVSNLLMEKLKPELDTMPNSKYLGDWYNVKIISTPYLPYIFRKPKKNL